MTKKTRDQVDPFRALFALEEGHIVILSHQGLKMV